MGSPMGAWCVVLFAVLVFASLPALASGHHHASGPGEGSEHEKQHLNRRNSEYATPDCSRRQVRFIYGRLVSPGPRIFRPRLKPPGGEAHDP